MAEKNPLRWAAFCAGVALGADAASMRFFTVAKMSWVGAGFTLKVSPAAGAPANVSVAPRNWMALPDVYVPLEMMALDASVT